MKSIIRALLLIGGFIIIGIAIARGPDNIGKIVPGVGSTDSAASSEKAAPIKTTVVAPVAKIDKSPEMQAKRRAFIQKLIKEDIFQKVEVPGSLPRVWVRPRFYSANFDEKQSFVSVVYAYHFEDQDIRNVVRRRLLVTPSASQHRQERGSELLEVTRPWVKRITAPMPTLGSRALRRIPAPSAPRTDGSHLLGISHFDRRRPIRLLQQWHFTNFCEPGAWPWWRVGGDFFNRADGSTGRITNNSGLSIS